MSKIISAVNAMIEHSDKITDICKSPEEIFFIYKNKYIWSMRKDKNENVYYLYYYKTTMSTQDLASMTPEDWNEFEGYIVYSTKELNTREAITSFKELYNLLSEKIFGLDKVLDDIISDF